RGLELGIAETAIAALGQKDALADLGEIGDQGFLVLVEDLRSGRHLERDVGAARAGAVRAAPVVALLRLEMLLVAVVDQRVQPVDAFRPYVAAASAVAAVRAAELNEFLAAKAHRPGAAGAGLDEDFRLVEKFHCAPALAEMTATGHRSLRDVPQAIRLCQIALSRRKRSTGNEPLKPSERESPQPAHWKPHFSITRREAVFVTRHDTPILSAPSSSKA